MFFTISKANTKSKKRLLFSNEFHKVIVHIQTQNNKKPRAQNEEKGQNFHNYDSGKMNKNV